MGVTSAERRLCQERREGPLNPALREDNSAEESGSWAAGGRGAGRETEQESPRVSGQVQGSPAGVWALRGAGSLPAGAVRVLSSEGVHIPHGREGRSPPPFPRTPLSIWKPGRSPGRDRWSSPAAREGLWVSSPLLFGAEGTSGALVRVKAPRRMCQGGLRVCVGLGGGLRAAWR